MPHHHPIAAVPPARPNGAVAKPGVKSPAAVAAPVPVLVFLAATDAAIAERAYTKFVARGRAHGFDQEDWAAAKRELSEEQRPPSRRGTP